ncbi:MAG: hypothetical protein H6667_11445 [Ardenticatenaceae bacterium]|nr:hypothetical protein [Ardenticatenaceae bacterium]
MSTLFLEPAELSYLLQTIRARSVVGVNHAELFPADEVENEALLKLGRDRLIFHGWLKPVPESGKINFDPSICYLIAIMADPETAVITLRQERRGTYQLITHYLAGQVIVEQRRTSDGLYQLGFVSSLATAVSRIQSVIQLSDTAVNQAAPQILLDRQAFTRIKNLASEGQTETAVAELQKEGIESSLAVSLVAAIQMPTYQGMIVVMQRENGQIVAKRNMAVMQSQQASWLIRMDNLNDPQIALESFWPQLFIHYLTGFLQNQPVNDN